jgi:hypothetical protein
VTLLLAPFAGGGLGPRTVYDYDSRAVTLSNDETVEVLYELPRVAYGAGEPLRLVREAAANGTVDRREGSVDQAVRNLTRYRFVADDFEDRYYRIGARVEDGRFVLNAARADPESIATAFAVPAAEAPGPVREALDEGSATSPRRVNSTLVESDGEAGAAGGTDAPTLVVRTGSERVGDPLAVPKVVSLALGVAAIVGGLVGLGRVRV